MPEIVKDLEAKGGLILYSHTFHYLSINFLSQGLLVEEEGRKMMFVKGVPLTVVKSDGGFTYDTSDLAALKHRVEVEKGDWLVYVVDSGQVRFSDDW